MAMRATQAYEKNLFARLFQGLRELPDLTFYGIANLSRFDYRAPTATFNLRGKTPQANTAAEIDRLLQALHQL
ncbi:MAG: hypothetical protein DCC52_19650 [Chloroflexi bacterium]|nr:MAG: hypothetical protein DCC52_19650 [Chloroflexota bacterium]